MKNQEISLQPSPHEEEDNLQAQKQLCPIPFFQSAKFQGTIQADITSNKKFMKNHAKITVALLTLILMLKILPSPLMVTIVNNNPFEFSKQKCISGNCQNSQEGIETVIIKKVNPLHRELLYFAKLNQQQLQKLPSSLKDQRFDLSKEISWVQIYSTRNGEIYGDAIDQKSGSEIYQLLFNNQPLVYIGQVHILSEASYLIKIYKQLYKYTVPSSRLLEGNSTNQEIEASNSTQNQTVQQESQQQKIPAKPVVKQVSVPITIEMVMYSEFYTGMQLLIRYVMFLFILYVRGQTTDCPKMFHAIILITTNPLIFSEIAFPNIISNVISTMCSSMYILFLPIFLLNTHQPHQNIKLDIFIRVLKIFGSLCLFIANILYSLHVINETIIEFVQYFIIILMIIPIFKYLWNIYFMKSQLLLHRNLLFIILALYYFVLLFFSGYLVDFGWKKIVFFLIVQAYGVSLCYLTAPIKQVLHLQSQKTDFNIQSHTVNCEQAKQIEKNHQQPLKTQSQNLQQPIYVKVL